MKRMRAVVELLFFTAVTLFLSAIMPRYFAWAAELQLLPALLAVNIAAIAFILSSSYPSGAVNVNLFQLYKNPNKNPFSS